MQAHMLLYLSAENIDTLHAENAVQTRYAVSLDMRTFSVVLLSSDVTCSGSHVSVSLSRRPHTCCGCTRFGDN